MFEHRVVCVERYRTLKEEEHTAVEFINNSTSSRHPDTKDVRHTKVNGTVQKDEDDKKLRLLVLSKATSSLRFGSEVDKTSPTKPRLGARRRQGRRLGFRFKL